MMRRDEPARLLGEDEAARERALDARRSFLVQAPAGSGKTELLIQRYLALLARVETPEQIVALTFTRKAAGEMRERVAHALRSAKEGREPAEPHERRTYALARAAIEQDARRGWAITEHASRMSMATFDALATELARRAPLAAGLGPHPEYIDDATPLFREAARNVIASAAADDASLARLLVHLDNNAPRLANLVAELLQRAINGSGRSGAHRAPSCARSSSTRWQTRSSTFCRRRAARFRRGSARRSVRGQAMRPRCSRPARTPRTWPRRSQRAGAVCPRRASMRCRDGGRSPGS